MNQQQKNYVMNQAFEILTAKLNEALIAENSAVEAITNKHAVTEKDIASFIKSGNFKFRAKIKDFGLTNINSYISNVPDLIDIPRKAVEKELGITFLLPNYFGKYCDYEHVALKHPTKSNENKFFPIKTKGMLALYEDFKNRLQNLSDTLMLGDEEDALILLEDLRNL